MAHERDDDNPHAFNDVAPGDSGPGEPGYEGRVQLGDVGDEPDSMPDQQPNTPTA